ncbi:MAG: hypothetical protein KatS3mg053_0651 [Candidatus Roseilinea sp.]|nr:MAG: hypothetical protein KatS3mg053_0651 [Candidatus Roseilinea sp.]
MVYRNLALMGILVVSALCGCMSVIDLPTSPSPISLNSLLVPAILTAVWILNLCSVLEINLLFCWKNETVNSVIKRKFGDAVRSVKPACQNREGRVQSVVYNAHR